MRVLTFGGLGFVLLFLAIAIVGMLPNIDIIHPVDFAYQPVKSVLDDPVFQEILSLSIFADVDLTISHAESKHAGDMPLYKKCMDDSNVILGFMNPDNKHCVEVFSTIVEEEGHSVERFVVRVVKKTKDKFYEITAFTDEWESLYDLELYLNNGGYMQIYP